MESLTVCQKAEMHSLLDKTFEAIDYHSMHCLDDCNIDSPEFSYYCKLWDESAKKLITIMESY